MCTSRLPDKHREVLNVPFVDVAGEQGLFYLLKMLFDNDKNRSEYEYFAYFYVPTSFNLDISPLKCALRHAK